MASHNLRMLERACTEAAVTLGAYDRRTLLWLAGWEPATCALIAGLITRAHSSAAGMRAGKATARR
jgi:hypothetical protein